MKKILIIDGQGGQAAAQKILIPISKCNNIFVGIKNSNITE